MRLEKTAWESRFTHAPLGILAQMIDPGSGDLSRQNVLDVFANRLRQRTMLALRRQAIVSGATAALILVAFPAWWSLASGAAALCLAAVWALIDRRHVSHAPLLARAIALLTTSLVILFAIGIALAAFTGDSRSPYGMCYDSSGRAFACDAAGARR